MDNNNNIMIFRVLNMIDMLNETLCGPNEMDYFKKIKFLSTVDDSCAISPLIREQLENLLCDNEIQYMEKNLYLIFNPGSDMSNVSDEQLKQYALSDLSDARLVRYFSTFCKSVSFIQKENLLLLKYSKCIFETGWSKFSLLCRGKVIDLDTMEIVGYPYDKFFNLNELPEYSINVISNAINNAKQVYVTNKLDGSLISITRYKDDYIVNTNGAFDNIHTEIARRLLFQKYKQFASMMPYNVTFIFELISPEDKHCLNYDDVDEGLYLTGIRFLKTNTLADYPVMLSWAREYGLNITEQEYLSLDEMLLKRTEKAQNKEGWVVRIVNHDCSDIMVKIKFEEFLIMHRMKAGINPRRAYNLYCFEDTSSLLESMPPEIAEGYLAVIEEININRQRINDKVHLVSRDICDRLGIDINAQISTEQAKNVAAEVRKISDPSIRPFAFMAMIYIRRKSVSRSIEMLQYDKYLKFVELL